MDKFLDFISINGWTMVMSAANLLILCYILKRILFKKVQVVLDKRQAEVDTIYNTAEKAQSDAEEMRTDYTARLANAKNEASSIVKTATNSAQLKSDNIIQEATTHASNMKTKAEADIEQEKKKALNEIKDEISGMAVDIATKIVSREVNEKDHKALIDDFINNVGDAI